MATVQDLEAALVNAHASGDRDAARTLAREIEVARRQQALNAPEGAFRSTVIDAPEPSPFDRISRGVWDGIQGAKQTYLLATDRPAANRYRDEVNEDEKRYQQGRGPTAGFDALRLGGNVLAGAPVAAALTAAAPEAATAALLGRIGFGATQGAVQGAGTYSPEGTWLHKGQQAAIGAAAGAGGRVVGEAASRLGARAIDAGRGLLSKLNADPERIVEAIEPMLAARGVSWGSLSAEVRDGMLNQARRQLSINGELTPEMLVRKLEMDDVLGPGIGPTRGQVLRNDPAQWSWERNAQKLPGDLGQPLTNRFRAQVSRLQEVAEDLRRRTGGQASNDYQAGASATSAITSKFEKSKQQVDQLYDAFRSSGAGTAEVKPQGIADTIGKVMDEYGDEHIPAGVRKRLESFGMLGGKQEKLLTVDEAEKLRKLIGNNIDPRNRPQMAALTILKDSVDEAVMGTEGAQTKLLQTARSAAAGRFSERDASGAVKGAVEGMEPDRFFQKFVVNGTVKDLRGLKATLNTGVDGGEAMGTQAWADLKGRVLEQMTSRAMGQGEGQFSGKSFRRALSEIGDERLKVLFEPAELEQLRKLDRVAYNLTAEPAFAAVNHSNTAAAGAQYLRDASRAAPRLIEAATNIPFVGKMAAGAWAAGDDVARNAEMRKRVGQALMGDTFDPDIKKVKRAELARLISRQLDPAASAATAGGSLYFTR